MGFKSTKCTECGSKFILLKRQANYINVCTNPDCSLKNILPIENWEEVVEPIVIKNEVQPVKDKLNN